MCCIYYLSGMKALSYPWSVNPKCLECHCCKHADVWMYINCPCTLLHTNLLLSQACCKLPKYLLCSCQHLSAEQLEKLWCISSVSFRPWPEHPFFSEGQRALKTKPVILFRSVTLVALSKYHERSQGAEQVIFLQGLKRSERFHAV